MLDDFKASFKDYIKIFFLVFLTISLIFIYSNVFSLHNGKLRVVFMDIGQGDSILIKSPSGNKIIVDGGPGSNILNSLSKNLSFWDRDIDMIVVTNPDKDHFEGFIPVLDSYKVALFLKPETEANDNVIYRELLSVVSDKKVDTIVASSGQKIDIGGGAFIEIIFPDRKGLKDLSHNDGSLVFRLVYGKTSILFTGDSTEKIEKFLLENYPNKLKSDILKVAHHGSKTSSSKNFIKEVSPKWAVISAGKMNSFGHPHKEVLDTLSSLNIDILGTYDKGDILFESNGDYFTEI